MYPEGTRSKDGKIHEGKAGIAKIYLETGVPILPVAIKGNFEIMPTGKSFPKFKKIVKINVGKLLEFKKELEIGRNLNSQSPEYLEVCQRITQKVMEEIKKLFEQL
jgi:1-acyl-sn-glycerol-3-phosphate acyltransferase